MSAIAEPAGATLAAAAKPRRFGAWYVAEHRLMQMRPWLQGILVNTFGTPLIYLFAMGIGLGTLVGQNQHGGVDGVSYLSFVAPALLAAAIFQSSAEEGMFPIMGGFLWNPIFLGMNASPLSPGQIIGGNIIYAVIERFVRALVYYGFMLLFGAVPDPGMGLLAVLAVGLMGLGSGNLVTAYTAGMKRDSGQFNYILRFCVVPLMLFSGTYFPLESMPVYLHWIGWVSPLWHGTQLARDACYGASEPGWLVAVHLLYLAALAVIGWLLARAIAARRLAA